MINPDLPPFIRQSAETCWVPVHPPFTSPCSPDDPWNTRNGITADEVWCFEGPGGDSTWPITPGQDWDHWSVFDPPGGSVPKWHVTDRQGNPIGGGTYNAYVGCDSVNSGTGYGFCPETLFWVHKRGYGDDWDYSLYLDFVGGPFVDGGTITFDIRYDIECVYDYVYLEYLDQNTLEWETLNTAADGSGNPVIFNGVSTNPSAECAFDVLGNGVNDTSDHGQGQGGWEKAVTFPVPNMAVMGGDGINLDLRWRGVSDIGFSDADGILETDGLGAIDNVSITLPTGDMPITISDDFETGDFSGIAASSGIATWTSGGLEGNSYDSWHMLFDPLYPNVGSTCTFSDEKDDWINTRVRWYDTSGSWSLWDWDLWVTFGGCEFWSINKSETLTRYLGANVESLQVAWEMIDLSRPGDLSWGKHGSVQFFIDNVSFGSFDGTATEFTAKPVDVFTDTFSRVDPAHSSDLQNDEQGLWDGLGGPRDFESWDSLTVHITDIDGLSDAVTTPANVSLYFRHDSATGPIVANQVWTDWVSKPMDLSLPDEFNAGWGDYRMIFGDDSGIGFDSGGEDGTSAVDGFIWEFGTTVQWYITVIDDAQNEVTFPPSASDPQNPTYFEWSVLPFGINTNGVKTAFDGVGGDTHVLLVDDWMAGALDFERSTGFLATGGVGHGGFTDPVYDDAQKMVERAMVKLYGGDATPETYDPRWDRYDVLGARTTIRCEPRGSSDLPDIGAYGDDLGNPKYDVVIWLHGATTLIYADATRLELANFLERGGRLLSMGDEVVFHLDFNGNNADSVIGFVQNYLGCDLPSSADDETADRTLSSVGVSGTSLGGIALGVYGECPIRRSFDRMQLSIPSGATNEVLMTYEGGDASDNGSPLGLRYFGVPERRRPSVLLGRGVYG
jgi:hypothetical protein